MQLFDSHTHVHFAAYDTDRAAVISRAKKAGVKMITVGTQRDTSKGAVEIAKANRGDIWAAVGLHPTHTTRSYHDEKELGGGEAAKAFTSRGEVFDYGYYESLAKEKEVVAIGECGLDYYRLTPETKELQLEAFKEQIRLAESVGKALMIHCRPSYAKAPEGKPLKPTDDAYEDLLEITMNKRQLTIPKIVHFYVGSRAITEKLLEAGFYFTFGGVITFARDYDESIAMIPLERILLETDAPYVAPEPYRGKKNEPAYVVETAKKLAELKGVDFETLADVTTKNAQTVFQIKK